MRDHHKLASSGVSEKQPIYLRSSLALMFAIMLHIRCHESQTAEKKGIKSYTDVCNYKNIILTARLSQKSHGATWGSYKSDRTPLPFQQSRYTVDPTEYLKQKVRYIHRIIYQDDDGFFYLKKHEKFMSLGDLLSFYMVKLKYSISQIDQSWLTRVRHGHPVSYFPRSPSSLCIYMYRGTRL